MIGGIDINEQEVILVDNEDHVIGHCNKKDAHERGLLHRAFSVFIFNDKNQILLQKRALNKYHSGGLWSNSCCSHPNVNESIRESIHSRLIEELGFDCEIDSLFDYCYRTELNNHMIENEYDHVFIGRFCGMPHVNSYEVCEWRWADTDLISEEINRAPMKFTYWFRELWPKVLKYMY